VLIPGQQGGYAAGAALFSGRQIVLALLVIAVVSVVLWIPVLSDQVMDFLTRNAPRYAPLTFLAGLGLLVIGVVAGIGILDIIGASMIGALALGYLVENY
jgi:small-conductance mechanosensitive channel